MRETLEFQKLTEAIISAQLQTGAKLVEEWVYEDEDGLEAFRVLELESEDDHRRHVRMVWPDLMGPRWFMGEPKRPWPLYGLMELPAGERVYICQSESAVHEARRAGLAAVAPALGANGVSKTDFSPLSGRDVVILPKHDESGRTISRTVSRALARQVPPAEVRVVQLPGVSLHGDLFEFGLLRGGCTAEVGAEIEALAERTPEFEVARLLPGPRRAAALPPALRTARVLDVRPGPVGWLWPGRIPLGKITLLFGGPGRGKSLVAADLAARVSAGAGWPDDGGPAPRGSVLFLSGQDALGDTVRPRLDRAGADLSRVIALDVPGRVPLAGALERAFAARGGSAEDFKLAIIDTVSGLLTGDVCAALDDLTRMAARTGVAIVLVASLGREHAGLARPEALGGHALFSAARSAWLAVPDVRDPARRLLVSAKNTLGTPAPDIAYRIVEGAVAWEPGAVDVGAEELLLSGRRRRKPGPSADKQAEAARWLLARLSAGPVYVGSGKAGDADSLRGELAAAGFSFMTLRRAFRALHLVSERCPATGRYRWRVPSQGIAEASGEQEQGPEGQ